MENLRSHAVMLSGIIGFPLSFTNRKSVSCQRSPFFRRCSRYQPRYCFNRFMVSAGSLIKRTVLVLVVSSYMPRLGEYNRLVSMRIWLLAKSTRLHRSPITSPRRASGYQQKMGDYLPLQGLTL